MIKVVLIDDEMWTRNTIKAFGDWKNFGIEIVGEASDGIEGINLINEKKPDIVITDMNMPGMDGIGLLKILKEDYPNIKVIVVSGYSDFNYTKQAVKSNAIDYILKPVDAEELNAALQKSIDEIQILEAQKDMSLYDLAKSLDKNIITLIMEQKKVLQRLLVDGNLAGIKNILNRLKNDIAKCDTNDVSIGKMIFKVYSEIVEEQLLIIYEHSTSQMSNQVEFKHQDMQKNSIGEYFIVIENMFKNAIMDISESTRNKKCDTLAQIKKYIESHYTEHISLESLANLFYISKEYLSKAFKAKFHKNLMNYIIELRMEKAKSMIEDKDISIKNICEAVGYDDISHFYRVFKNYYGISPGEMRKKDGLKIGEL
jgi:Response regulator containing CheY-like receiver domain and AraC-type DNA-binding domain